MASSSTFHRLAITFLVPATWKALWRPKTPSPSATSPSPVSQAERTTSSRFDRGRAAIVSAVRIPPSPSGNPSSSRAAPILAPARTSPERTSGLRPAGASRSLAFSLAKASASRRNSERNFASAKNPWVAIWAQRACGRARSKVEVSASFPDRSNFRSVGANLETLSISSLVPARYSHERPDAPRARAKVIASGGFGWARSSYVTPPTARRAPSRFTPRSSVS